MTTLFVRPGQNVDGVLRKFKKKVEAEGIIEDVRKRMFYIKPGEKARLKHKRAVSRQLKEKSKYAT